MKIPHSISARYDELVENYRLLAAVVKPILENNIRSERWLVISRIKPPESFYVKAQSCRWDAVYEDLLAATIVVENANQVKEAIRRLLNFFELDHRKPSDGSVTSKRPDSFVFDDLRLYLRLKARDVKKETMGLVFECQVKTFLQHAWSIATHDLIYKPADVCAWSSARVAYQVKAMLEHAEVAISKVDAIAQSEMLDMHSSDYEERDKILEDLRSLNVDVGELPERVIDNLRSLLRRWGYAWGQVFPWIKAETDKGDGHGVRQLRFSIYEVVVDAIVRNDGSAIRRYDEQMKNHRVKALMVSDELVETHPGLNSIGKKV